MAEKGRDDIRNEMDKAFYTKEGIPIITEGIKEQFMAQFAMDSEHTDSRVLGDNLAEEIRKENPVYLTCVDNFVKIYPEQARPAIRLTFLSLYCLLKMQAEYYSDIKGIEKRAGH